MKESDPAFVHEVPSDCFGVVALHRKMTSAVWMSRTMIWGAMAILIMGPSHRAVRSNHQQVRLEAHLWNVSVILVEVRTQTRLCETTNTARMAATHGCAVVVFLCWFFWHQWFTPQERAVCFLGPTHGRGQHQY